MQAAQTGHIRSGGRGLCGQSASAGRLRASLRDGCPFDQTWPDVRPSHRHLAAVCLHRYCRSVTLRGAPHNQTPANVAEFMHLSDG